MPTSPDRTWTDLLDGLDDNNVGGITEEDVRALAKFSKVSVAEFGNSLYPVTTASWTGTLSATPNTAQVPVYTKLINSGAGNYLTSYNDLEVDTSNGLFRYSSTNAVAPRLFQMTWRVEAYMPSLQNLAVVFYYVSDGDTFPTSTRHIADRIWYVGGDNADGTVTRGEDSSGEMSGSGDDYSIAKTSGSGYIYLAPGSKVVPVLEYYGPDALIEFNASYHLGMHSLGVVEVDAEDAYFTTAYWDGVSNKVIDTEFPTSTERRLGSLT